MTRIVVFAFGKILFAGAVMTALIFLPGTPVQAQEKITVLLDWFINPDHGPLIIAKEKGFFDAEGLDVEFVEPADPNDPPKLVAAGKAELAVSYQPQLHLQIDQGLPLSRVATLVATPLNSLVVLDAGPVKSIADLKGKKIGYSVGGFEDVLLAAMLEEANLSLDDVELINVNFSLSPSLLSGQVDAVIGAFRNFELNQMDIENRPGRAFYIEEHGIPAYDELIIVSNNDTLTDPRLPKLIHAIELATQYIVNHSEEAWQLFAASKSGLDDELNRRAWRDTLPRFALRPGALDHNRYATFAAFLEQRGLIKAAPDTRDYAVELPVGDHRQ